MLSYTKNTKLNSNSNGKGISEVKYIIDVNTTLSNMCTTTCFVNTLFIKTVDKSLSYDMHVWSHPPPTMSSKWHTQVPEIS